LRPEPSSAAGVRAARERLLCAGPALRRSSRTERVRVLGRVFERLRAPESPERARLEAELPAATGLTAETVHEGLARALAPFSAAALEALVQRELGALGPGRVAFGFEATAVLLGGGVPTPALPALAGPLLLGSPVLARAPAHDPVTAPAFADALAAEDASLAEALAVVSFPSDDEEAMRELIAAPCVVGFGADETLAAVAARLAPTQRFVRHGHRLSVALLGEAALAGPALAEAADALALDVALWDQRGCLSPVAAWVLGVERVPDAVFDALARAFADAASRWPRGRALPEQAARFAVERDTAELRAAAGAALRVTAAKDYVLVAEPDAGFHGSPLQRFLRLHPAPSPERLLEALAPLAPHLAGVGVAGLGPHAGRLAAALADLGASRICPLGSLQAPPLAWCHDQGGVLLPVARLADVEV
jgi:hypothetical protein